MHKKSSLFIMKRLMLLGLMALMLSTSLALTTGIASAKTTSSARAAATTGCYSRGDSTHRSCDGQNPESMGCWGTSTLYIDNYNSYWHMKIFAYYSPTCDAAWAGATFDSPKGPGVYGDAIVTRTSDNKQFDCTTGDQIIYPGQTYCYSGMVGGGGGWGAGMINTGGGWFEVVRTLGSI